MKRFIIPIILLFLASCGGNKEPASGTAQPQRMFPDKKNMTYEEALKDWRNNFGIGPIKKVQLGEIDQKRVEAGKASFDLNCTACHEPYKEKIGPALVGITARRTPEWIQNMMLNPAEMSKTDPICLGLLVQYNYTVMADQQLTEDESRNILEYFRTLTLDNATDPI